MPIADLFNVPDNPAEKGTWDFHHADHHHRLIEFVYKVKGIQLAEFCVDPFAVRNSEAGDNHQRMHDDLISTLMGPKNFTIPISLPALSNGEIFEVTPGFTGQLLGISLEITTAVTTNHKAATLQAQVEETNLTGGVISLSGLYAVGAVVPGTPIVGGIQTFSWNESIGFSVSGVTPFIEGAAVVTLFTVFTPINAAYDLTDVDWQNRGQIESWVWLNAQAHMAFAESTGVD